MSACNDDVQHGLFLHISRLNYLLRSVRCKYDRGSCQIEQVRMAYLLAQVSGRGWERINSHCILGCASCCITTYYADTVWCTLCTKPLIKWYQEFSTESLLTFLLSHWCQSQLKFQCIQEVCEAQQDLGGCFPCITSAFQDHGLVGSISASKRCH